MKSWWKGLKRNKLDKKLCNDFIASVGVPPTKMYFNVDHKYWELFWEEEDSENYLQLKIGLSLAKVPEGYSKKINIIWVYFNHPAAGGQRISPWYLGNSTSIIELVLECREAIHLLQYGE